MKSMNYALVCSLSLLGSSVHSDPTTLTLSANNMLAQTHSHAIVVNITGTYRELFGTLHLDPEANTCAIDVTFTVKSLAMPNSFIRSQTMSKDFLDPDEFPQTHYVAACHDDKLIGQLTLRGQTHPFNMSIAYDRTGGRVTAVHARGELNRFDWGVTGSSFTVSKMITVSNDISLTSAPPSPSPK
jgi:polyisoprenoid-binding protein YceI